MTAKRASKRNDILSAAYTLFRKHGFHDTGVAALSDLANVSTATLYKHFSGKEEILAACIETQMLRQTDGSVETDQAEVFLEAVSSYSPKWCFGF